MPTRAQDRLAELEAALFRVSRTVWGARVSGYASSVPIERAGIALLGRLTECGDARLSDLAAQLGLDVSTVSRQVRQLVDLDLLERSPDPADGRAARLRVTDRGERVVEDVRAARRDLLGRALADWPTDDRTTLTRLLTRLADDLGTDLCSFAPRQENS